MLDDIVVKDVYIKIDDYPHIPDSTPVGQAIHIMHNVLEDKSKFRNILVLDEDNRLAGYLSLRDLIRAIGPDYLRKERPDIKGHQPFEFTGLDQDMSALSLIWQEGFMLKLQDELKKPAKDCMTLIEDYVALEDNIAKCLYLMLFHDVLVLPVLDGEQVVGVIRLVDLFELIAEDVEEACCPEVKGGR